MNITVAIQSGFLSRQIVFNRTKVRLLVYGLCLVQAITAAAVSTSGFIESYWLIDYQHGFVRRGLGGELLRIATGGQPSGTAITAMVVTTAVVSAGCALILIELLIRRFTKATVLMALLLAASPFLIDQMVLHRRPDQFGLLALFAVGVVCAYRRHLAINLAAVGFMLAALTLVHEGALLFYGVFCVPLILAALPEINLVRRLALVAVTVGPALVVALFVLAFGRLQQDAITSMEAYATTRLGDQPTVLSYMDDSVGTSIQIVAQFGPVRQILMLIIGAALVAAHWLWIRHWIGTRWMRLGGVPRAVWWTAALGVAVPVVFTFGTGVDWMRWFGVFGSSALMVVGFLVLIDAMSTVSSRSGTVTLTVGQVAAAMYLTLLVPMRHAFTIARAVVYPIPLFPL